MSVDALKERLDNLQKLLIEELAGDNNKLYLTDLNTSINDIKRSLSFYQKNPDGVQMVSYD